MKPGIDPKVDYVFKWLFGKDGHVDLQEGEEYAELCPCITICFLDGILFPGVPDHHLSFGLHSALHPQLVFNDQLAIHLVELPKFRKSATELGDLFDSWCYFLIHGDDLDTEDLPKALRHCVVGKAMEELAMFAQSDVEKQRYHDRIKAERDQRSFLREAREEGELMGRIRVFQSLLNQTITASDELAKLTIAELQTMADSLEQRFKSK